MNRQTPKRTSSWTMKFSKRPILFVPLVGLLIGAPALGQAEAPARPPTPEPAEPGALHIELHGLFGAQHADASEPGQLRIEVEHAELRRQEPLDPELLAAGLADPDLDARERFLDRLLVEAAISNTRRGQTRAWLEATAAGQGELAWTARLALRELNGTPVHDPLMALFTGGPEARGLGEGFGGWEVKLEHLEEGDQAFVWAPSTGLEDPREELLLVPGGTGGLRTLIGLAPGDPNTGGSLAPNEWGELDFWIDSSREQNNRFPVAELEAFENCTFELRCGPGEARLRILEIRADGQVAPEQLFTSEAEPPRIEVQRVREYTGSDLHAILERHPEVSLALPFQVSSRGSQDLFAPRTDVLGVFTRSVPPERCLQLGLEPGCGVEVERVLPGSVAQVLGLSPGSVIVEICGTEVRGEEGIREALDAIGARPELKEVCVVWYDGFGRPKEGIWQSALAGSRPHAALHRRAAEQARQGQIRVEVEIDRED